jgi:Ca2+/H+ antiporter
MNWNQECLVTKKTKEKAGKEELMFYALNVSKLVTTMVFSENQCLLMFSSLRVCVYVSLLLFGIQTRAFVYCENQKELERKENVIFEFLFLFLFLRFPGNQTDKGHYWS